ncbi:MAG: DUF5714 domain-containing protein [Dehalococcoidia bacterium]|nr:DUF5714 domain-containing protein [Dehalococcoidia bacterium]
MVEMQDRLKFQEHCALCGRPLVYGTEAVERTCDLCRQVVKAQVYCPEGHYVCDACHARGAIGVLRQVVFATRSTSPAEIAEAVMSHPLVPMHGPEHHAIVAASIVTAVRNVVGEVPDGAVEKAIDRASKVPGGWCGLYGDCGAAVGVGVAVSVLSGATPLTGRQRSLAMSATVFAMSRMIDDQPRCCKRAVRTGIDAAVVFLRERMNIFLPLREKATCSYFERNQQCAKTACPYFPI